MYRVLTVDSSVLSSQVINYALSTAGFDVAHCANRSELPEMLEGYRPHVLVYNLDMPLHSVASHCSFLSSTSRSDRFKVLLFSGEDERLLSECVEEGFADGYYVKDPENDPLLDSFAEMVGRLATEASHSA